MTELEQLKIDKSILLGELVHLRNVINNGDWWPVGDFKEGEQMMQIPFVVADEACTRARKIIEEFNT